MGDRKKEIGETLRDRREKMGYTQAQLAELLGYDKKRQDVIAAIEAGRRLPPVNKLRKLAELCSCRIDQLIE